MDTKTHDRWALGVLAIAVVVAVVVVLILKGYLHLPSLSSQSHGALIPSTARITLSANDFPQHNVFVVDPKKLSLAPEHISSQGTGNLYGEVLTKSYGYYLISGPAAEQSTLYRSDLEHPNAGLQQLTKSDSDKVELSVLEPADLAAFTARVKEGVPHVFVVNLKTGKETDVGPGSHPYILSGSSVLIEQADAVVSVDIATGKVHQLASIHSGALVAVNSDGSQFMVYDPTSNTVQQYSIAQNGSAATKLGSSVPGEKPGPSVPGERPEALFYYNAQPYMARMQQDTLVLSSLDAVRTEKVQAPGFSLNGFNITAQ